MPEAAGRIEEARPRRFRPYPAYRDSGVDWLGEIPVGWQLTKLKRVADVQASSVDKKRHKDEVDVRFLGTDTVYNVSEIWNGLTLEAASVSAKEIDKYSLRDGDIVLTKDSVVPTRIADVSIVVEPLYNVVCGYHLTMIRPNLSRVLPRYLFWYLGCSVVNAFFLSESRGTTIIGLGSNTIGGVQALLGSSIDEQRAIAAFLDRETAKIDGLVERKERLIELLQEKRAALITRAVTRGLDPNAPMKDSGVAWLGDIPAHWVVKKLGYLTNIGNGSTPNRNEARYWVDGSHPWLTSGKINEGVIATADQFVTDVAFRECHLPPVPAGSVLVAITGEGQTRGRAALLSIDSTISQHLAYITPSYPEINAGFLVRLFEARYEWLREESSGSGSTRAALTCEFLRSIRLAFPPRREQRSIDAFLDRETAKIDTLIAKIQQAIEHLKEFRTALISAAVTGKIDVREEAA